VCCIFEENKRKTMIQEITNFIDYLEKVSSDVFCKNLNLKKDFMFFFENEGDELVIKDEGILKVEKNRTKSAL